MGYQNLIKTSKAVSGMNLSISGDISGLSCHECSLGKMSNTPYRSKSPRARHALDLIHMDINVINVEGIYGEKYLLIITDDYSGCRFGFPLVSRSGEEIVDKFNEWLPWAERMADQKMKVVRHDNAK